MASKPRTDLEAAGALAIEYAPTIADAAHEQPDRLDEKLGVDELAPSERPIDYQKMEEQQIGVTRIETLWRHFGTNRPILTSLGLTIFREFVPPPSARRARTLAERFSRLLRLYARVEHHVNVRPAGGVVFQGSCPAFGHHWDCRVDCQRCQVRVDEPRDGHFASAAMSCTDAIVNPLSARLPTLPRVRRPTWSS